MDINIWTAFIGGFISFFSPCILPIIPGYLSFIAGSSAKDTSKNRFRIFQSTIFFVLGFALIFTLLGTAIGAISKVFLHFRDWLNWISGTLIIVFGLFMMKLLDIPFLNKDFRLKTPTFKKKNYLSAFIMGGVFAIAWSPCVSAILASILVLAITSGSEAQGALMLLFFSLGLGIPFLLTAIFIDKARRFIHVSGPFLEKINIIAGILLVILGILVFTGKLTYVLQFLLA